MTPDLSVFQTDDGELVQEQQRPVVSTSPHPVTLLATSNGTHIAVQVHKHRVKIVFNKPLCKKCVYLAQIKYYLEWS